MKKLLFLIVLCSLLYCSNDPIISYQKAPIESVLTCCGSVKNENSHYIITSRAATPKRTKDERCTRPENVFYRIAEYPDGEITLTLVCKINNKYIELSDETFSY